MENTQNWEKFKSCLFYDNDLSLQLDISKVRFSEDFFTQMEPLMQKVYTHIDELEKGSIANPDEKRMVGHYWLRNPELAPQKYNKIRQSWIS